MTHTLKHKNILQNGLAVQLVRATLTSARPKALHQHDFHEVFWVQNGTVRHHTDTGMEVLREGAFVMIPPNCRHALQGKGEHAMVVSLCLRPDVIAAFAQRHPQLREQLFWSPDIQVIARNSRQLADLNQSANILDASKRDPLAVEAFLAPLCTALLDSQNPMELPDWLANACLAAQKPAVFQHGASGLVAAAGRAHPHVSRTMRDLMGQSPSEYINTIRMNFAARALVSDSEPISEIARTCGIPNMPHFHKLFRAHHGTTPLQYRQQLQRDVVQPN